MENHHKKTETHFIVGLVAEVAVSVNGGDGNGVGCGGVARRRADGGVGFAGAGDAWSASQSRRPRRL